ncbi:MAG: glycosyltransferase family 4 protein [Peptococcaceae bacterium]|nr:glycosyltransferase family 4 protein [Peptococcaceae bacterium]
MKIGIFTDSYRPYRSGVVESIDLFTRELRTLGHQVDIFAPSYPKCIKDSRVFRFASLPAPTNPDFTIAIPISIKLRPAMKKIMPDIIHVQSPFILGRLGAKYARSLDVPLVFTFHTLYDLYTHYIPFLQSLTKDITRRYYRDFCNSCDLVITPTDSIADYLRKNGITADIQTIPTGIDIECFALKDQQSYIHTKHGLPKDTRVLLCVGRLGQEKNLPFLIHVFARIHARYPDTQMVLVGGGPEEDNLKEMAFSLGVGDKIIFTGVLDRKEVAKYYNSAYLFVFASITETQGLVIGEAKAAGVPALAVNAYGVGDMIEHGIDGFLTDNSFDDFQEKLELLLSDIDLRNRMGQTAYENSFNLSSAISAQKLVTCYEELIYAKNNSK